MENNACSAKIKVGILTISDRCFNNMAEDLSGASLKNLVESGSLFMGEVVVQKCTPDDKQCIQEVLIEWADIMKLDLAISTGGTGLAPRDVTPEAVKEIIEKEAIGMTMKIISDSLQVTPMAMLSRPICGTRGCTLIVTLPGSSKASQECLRFVAPAITHAVHLLNDRKNHVERTHSELQKTASCVARPENTGDRETDDDHVESTACFPPLARRHRHSPYPLISVEKAQEEVLSKAHKLPFHRESVTDCLGFSLAKDVFAADPLPPFAASIKDGYAVQSSDSCHLRRVIGQSCAGMDPDLVEVVSDACMRINTGAPIPPGADAVVQVEDTEVITETDGGAEEVEIRILKLPLKGQDIRPRGSDISVGDRILMSGVTIGPSEMGVLASAGVKTVSVYRKPTVAVLSTGNELQEPFGKPLDKGCIYDSNKVTLISLLKQHGIPSLDAGIAEDTFDGLLGAMRKCLRKADVLVTSGGVSMGDKDLLKPILLDDLKAKIHFAQVFMKPGKPTTFATCSFEGKQKLILGLPGNPVSAIVTAHLYLLPICRKMAGREDYQNTTIKAQVDSPICLDRRPEYHRATLSWSPNDDFPTAHTTGNQLSSRLLSMTSAQALLQLPPSTDERITLPSGSVVEAILLNL